jgi:ADP-heptose:LPS heptosyltransferase
LRNVAERLESFADTAALIAQLDLVIAVDTAVAHLAAALGKPVWIALPFTPDWRWQMNRSDSPWYAGVRLFRQSARGDWSDVVCALREALAAPFVA